jgi:hypothetical protein
MPQNQLNWKYVCTSTNTSDEIISDIPNAVPSSKVENILDLLSHYVIYSPNAVLIRRSLIPVTGSLQFIPEYTFSEQNVVFGFAIEDHYPSIFSQRSDPRFFFAPARGGNGKWSPYWSSFKGRSSILLGEKGEEKKTQIDSLSKYFYVI